MKHVMIDLYGCPPEVLTNAELLEHILNEYPHHIGMQKVSPIVLRDIKTSCPLDDGLSGFVIIATSHISLHAWPHYGMVNLDVFSCEAFDTTIVGHFAMQMFQTSQIELHEVERALRSPRGTFVLTPHTVTSSMITTNADEQVHIAPQKPLTHAQASLCIRAKSERYTVQRITHLDKDFEGVNSEISFPAFTQHGVVVPCHHRCHLGMQGRSLRR